MIPIHVAEDLSWYLELLRNDGKCCQTWRNWSNRLYEAGILPETRQNWDEWKTQFLSDAGIRGFCWKGTTWDQNRKKIARTLQVDFSRKETWKFWHQTAHAADCAAARKKKWRSWGKRLREYGISQFLTAVPEEVDSDPDVALTEKLFLARYEDVRRIKSYMEGLDNKSNQCRRLKALGEEMVKEYSTFSKKEISVEIQRKLEVWTCPYCNSHYMEPRVDYKTGRVHAGMQMDHFYPKERYGILSMSLFNLVPSCSYCNHEKGSGELRVSVYNKNVHAYDTVFRYEPDNVDFLMNQELSLYLEVNRRHDGTVLQNAQDILSDKCGVLHLALRQGTEVDRVKYTHGLSVVEELIENARDNPLEQQLFLREFGFPEEEARAWYWRVLGGRYVGSEADFLKSPYSKLKTDIINQILGKSIGMG